MEKEYFKIEIEKVGDTWTASLFMTTDESGIKDWQEQNQVQSDSYIDLTSKMADEGFIDLLNKNG